MSFSGILLLALGVYFQGGFQHTEPYKTRLIVTGQLLEIPIDENTAFETPCMFPYTENGRSLLTYLNEGENEIHFYDLQSRRLIKKIALDYDGDNGVGTAYAFHVCNPDSIYIASANDHIYLINGQGEIRYSIDYTHSPIDGRAAGKADVGSARHIEIVERNNKLIVYTGLRGDWLTVDRQYLNYQYLELEIDPRDNSMKLLPMTYPTDYIDRGLKPFEASREYVNGKFIYSFAADHHIYITADHQSIIKKLAKSDFIREFPALTKDMNPFSYRRYIEQNSFYGSLVYDPYRKVYYRFCDLASNLMNIEGYRQHQSIIILDSDFNKIGEVRLPDRKFNTTNYFVGIEGLYLSNNTPYNPHLDKGKLSFTLLKLEGNSN